MPLIISSMSTNLRRRIDTITTPYDEREWHDPKKEVFRDPEYTDADKHKTKKPIKI